MLRCVIIDDEPLAREVLEGYLKTFGSGQSVRQFGNAQDALAYLENEAADVLFLDIEMPGLNGIDFLRILENPPVTVFTTAYRDYAFEGFELGVIDFLLKPIVYSRFLQTMEKIGDFLSLKEQQAAIEQNTTEEKLGPVFVKSGVQRIKLDFDDVTHIQGLKDYAIIHTGSGRIVIKGSIKAMQEIFPPTHFLRVHKSFIVSLAKVRRIERNRIVINGHQIPVGRNFKSEVEKRFS